MPETFANSTRNRNSYSGRESSDDDSHVEPLSRIQTPGNELDASDGAVGEDGEMLEKLALQMFTSSIGNATVLVHALCVPALAA